MKKYLLFIFFSVSVNSLFSQTNFRFADSTAQWNVLGNQNGMWCNCIYYYTNSYTVSKDTTVLNIACQKISDGSFIWRDSIGKVFRISSFDTAQRMMYDFSKNKNDTFSLTCPGGNCFGIVCKVDSVDTVTLGGKLRKRMFITYNNDSWKPDVWIDGIGSTQSHFLDPGIDHTIIDGDSYILLCFSEKDSLLYHDPYVSSCYEDTVIYLGIKVEGSVTTYFLIPNPASSFLTIQSENNFPEQTAFQLFDLTGRMVLQKQLTEKNTQLDVSGMSKGMYLYNISSSNQKLGSGKLVVE